MGRGAIWLISSTMRTVLASGVNPPVSMAFEERLKRPGLRDAGVLERVGLPPGGRHADDRSPVRGPGLD